MPVDTLYRTSIISSSTALPLNLFVNLSLASLSLFLTYGLDLGVWPDCWVCAEFLRAPIPRKGSGSTTNIIRIRAYDKEPRLKLRSINMKCKIFFFNLKSESELLHHYNKNKLVEKRIVLKFWSKKLQYKLK